MIMIRNLFATFACLAMGASAQQCSMQCLLQMNDGITNPCGCNFIKKTSRGELRSMALPDLRKGLGELSTDVVDLEKQIKDTEETQKKSEQNQKD
jgi:hypothetical protein